LGSRLGNGDPRGMQIEGLAREAAAFPEKTSANCEGIG